MNNLSVINISGIDCYERNGTAYLKLDTVARGLGFTQEKGGVEYVRWETVDRYLREIGFPSKLGKEDLPKNGERPEFIPENIFYRLAMKAKNEAAEAFQAKIADEVIPAIRKTGGYNPKPMTANEMFSLQAQINLDNEREIKELKGRTAENEKRLDETNRKFDAVTTFVTSPLTDADTWQERMTRHIRRAVEEFGLNYQQFHAKLYDELERTAGVSLKCRQTRMRNRMYAAGATKTECKAVSKLSVIAADKKLRAMFETILRNEIVRLATSRAIAG